MRAQAAAQCRGLPRWCFRVQVMSTKLAALSLLLLVTVSAALKVQAMLTRLTLLLKLLSLLLVVSTTSALLDVLLQLLLLLLIKASALEAVAMVLSRSWLSLRWVSAVVQNALSLLLLLLDVSGWRVRPG